MLACPHWTWGRPRKLRLTLFGHDRLCIELRRVRRLLHWNLGVNSRNGQNRTLSRAEHSERPELTLFNQSILVPAIVTSQVDVLPA